MDLAMLAPEPEEEVMSLDALAPEPAEEPAMDLAMLAPEPARSGPDESAPGFFDEPVFDLDALAPARTPSESALASPPPATDETVDITFLSPDEPDEIVIDLDALRSETVAPSSSAPPPAHPESAAAAPATSPVARPSAAEGDDGARESEAPSTGDEDGEPVYTRTLAELYVAQGATKQAIEVLRHLRAKTPADEEITRRLVELEAGAASAAPEAATKGDERDEEIEALARDLAEGGSARHEVDTPFAWAESEPEASPQPSGPTIREYFDGLLNWEPRDRA
jgi:hypothetical protein